MEKNFKAVLAFRELLAGSIPLGFSDLAFLLGKIMGLLCGDELLFGGIQRLARGRLGGCRLLCAGGGGSNGKSGNGNLLLKLQGTGTFRIAAGAGRGEITADIGQTILELMKAVGQRLGLALRTLTLLPRLLKSGGTSLKRFLLGAQHIEQ